MAALIFGLMAVLARWAAGVLPAAEIAFVRFAIGLLACAAAALRVQFRARNKLGLVLRGAYGGIAVLFYFLAIAHLPVGIATLLNYTMPVFAALYAAAFLREPVARGTLVALAMTTLGVAIVIAGTAPTGGFAFGLWHLVGLGSAMFSGAAVATIRQVRKTDGSWEIFAAFCIAGAAVTGPPAMLQWRWPTPLAWAALVGVGVTSVVAQLLMTHALRYVRAAVGGVIAQLTPVSSLAFGWLMLDERIGGLAIGGAALTLAGVTLGTYLASTREPDEVGD